MYLKGQKPGMQPVLGIHSQTHPLIHGTRPGTSAYHSPAAGLHVVTKKRGQASSRVSKDCRKSTHSCTRSVHVCSMHELHVCMHDTCACNRCSTWPASLHMETLAGTVNTVTICFTSCEAATILGQVFVRFAAHPYMGALGTVHTCTCCTSPIHAF